LTASVGFGVVDAAPLAEGDTVPGVADAEPLGVSVLAEAEGVSVHAEMDGDAVEEREGAEVGEPDDDALDVTVADAERNVVDADGDAEAAVEPDGVGDEEREESGEGDELTEPADTDAVAEGVVVAGVADADIEADADTKVADAEAVRAVGDADAEGEGVDGAPKRTPTSLIDSARA